MTFKLIYNLWKQQSLFTMTNMIHRFMAAATIWLASVVPAMAFEPKPGEIGMQPAASPNMERLTSFHNDLLMWVITAIVIFVFLLLVWIVIRYNAKANPVPSKTTHNVLIEVIWTVLPVIILIVIAVPSYKLLYYNDRTAEPDMTLKISGYQWGWTYTYPDYNDIEFNADPILEEDEMNKYIPDGKGRRLLETYNPIVVPIEKNVQVLMTATDVIHAWTIPAFGLKKDAVPGRTNEAWFRATVPGVYYGQCSEICGINHALMPIAAYAVTFEEFEAWTECMNGNGAEANADYPSRACIQKLGFDKYRNLQKGNNVAQQTNTTGANE
jgi:cytochrome c oxidase subunit 2